MQSESPGSSSFLARLAHQFVGEERPHQVQLGGQNPLEMDSVPILAMASVPKRSPALQPVELLDQPISYDERPDLSRDVPTDPAQSARLEPEGIEMGDEGVALQWQSWAVPDQEALPDVEAEEVPEQREVIGRVEEPEPAVVIQQQQHLVLSVENGAIAVVRTQEVRLNMVRVGCFEILFRQNWTESQKIAKLSFNHL
jgi:hypothetical protein